MQTITDRIEQTRQELTTRLNEAVKESRWQTAEHWIAELRKLADVECMIAAYAPEA